MTTSSTAAERESKLRVEEMGRRIDRLRRRIFDPDVLRGVLPVRARLVPHRAAMPDARDREARFRAASPAYARAMADTESFAAETQVTALDSLTWWVPLTRPGDAAHIERYLEQQDFPYRAIAQTRDVAIGGTMIDIGANIGRMCIPRAILGDITAAYCAEPDPLNYACLVRNVRDNGLAGLVLPDHLAIGSEDATVRLERSRNAGGHRVIEPGKRSKHEVVEVPSLTLDTWIERVGIDLQQLVFVKLDAQGSEVHVLRGAGRVLACRHVTWQIEVDLPLLAKRGFQADDLFAPVRRHFTHFIDLNRDARGPRARPVAELAEALAYVTGGTDGRTDILAFTAEMAAPRG